MLPGNALGKRSPGLGGAGVQKSLVIRLFLIQWPHTITDPLCVKHYKKPCWILGRLCRDLCTRLAERLEESIDLNTRMGQGADRFIF